MAQGVPTKIIPRRATETISISCVEYINKFKPKFQRKDLIRFFIVFSSDFPLTFIKQ